MSRNPMITILTMYNIDDTIFDDLHLPEYHFPRMIEYDDLFLKEGWTLDKETLINNIILECGELDLIYTDPDFLKFAIKTWAAKEYPVWRSLYESLFYKYNPIWNKDGTIKESERQIRNLVLQNERSKQNNAIMSSVDNENIDDTDNTTTSNNGTTSASNTETGNRSGSETTSSDNVNSVSAFDDLATFSNHDKSETGSDKTNSELFNNVKTESISNDETGHNDRTYNRERVANNNTVNTGSETEINRNNDTGNVDNNNERVERGNIGVTTTQQMISAERDLVKFNLYDFIIDSFKARFCIMVY